MSSIATNLESVRAKIHAMARRSGRDPGAVRLVLVTKTVEPIRVREAIDAGQHDLGEKKVQEGCRKAEVRRESPMLRQARRGLGRGMLGIRIECACVRPGR